MSARKKVAKKRAFLQGERRKKGETHFQAIDRIFAQNKRKDKDILVKTINKLIFGE